MGGARCRGPAPRLRSAGWYASTRRYYFLVVSSRCLGQLVRYFLLFIYCAPTAATRGASEFAIKALESTCIGYKLHGLAICGCIACVHVARKRALRYWQCHYTSIAVSRYCLAAIIVRYFGHSGSCCCACAWLFAFGTLFCLVRRGSNYSSSRAGMIDTLVALL